MIRYGVSFGALFAAVLLATPAHAADPATESRVVRGVQQIEGNDLLPPNPLPGECYARVVLPARYQTQTGRIKVRDEGSRIEIIPARYQKVTERVLVKEASTRLETIPPVYETVSKRVLVEPAVTKVVEVPAKYRTQITRVVDKPAHTVWKRGGGLNNTSSAAGVGGAAQAMQRFGGSPVLATRMADTGEVMCLVEVPATYRTIERQVLVSPATTKKLTRPPKYGVVQTRVVKTPARTREVTIPAEYKNVTRIRTVREAQERRIPIPAKYDTITRKVKVRDERIEWQPVLCDINMTPSNVSQLQSALQQQGCYRCGVDGVIGQCTIKAAQCFAEKRGLPYGSNFITMEVVRALGLNLQ